MQAKIIGSWAHWLLALLLALAGPVVSGCDDDNDRNPATEAPEDADPDAPEAAEPETPEAPEPEDADGVEPDISDVAPLPGPLPAPALLAAPTLVYPPNGSTLPGMATLGGWVMNLRWWSVAGARSYIVDVDGNEYPAERTEIDVVVLRRTSRWKVWAVNEVGAKGLPSETFTFTMENE